MLARLIIKFCAEKNPNNRQLLFVHLSQGFFTKQYIVFFINSYEDVIQKTSISLEARKYIRDSSAFHFGLGLARSNSRFSKTQQGFADEITRPSDLPSYLTVPTGMNSFPIEFMRTFLVFNPKW